MEDKRSKTLLELSRFIEAQKVFLSRAQADIQKLRAIKSELVNRPNISPEHVGEELQDSSCRFSEQFTNVLHRPEHIDWSVFAFHDSAGLKGLASSTQSLYARRNEPYETQQSELSDLQKFVKEARHAILDPVLSQISLQNEDDSSMSEGEDPEQVRRERERDKIIELKKRKIECRLTIPLRARGSNGVFIRQDLDDESANVDISLDDTGHIGQGRSSSSSDSMPVESDTPATSATPPRSAPSKFVRPARSRRLPKRLRIDETGVSTPDIPDLTKIELAAKQEKETDMKPELEPYAQPIKKKSRDAGKPKPDTYKLAWSVSEQHLLERLLEEIPDGEKNRWQKISQAMHGRRTPRQVASRVQKYFEKLKRFGIAVDARNETEPSGS